MTTKTWGARALAVTAALGLVLAIGTVTAGAGSFERSPSTRHRRPGEDFTVSGGGLHHRPDHHRRRARPEPGRRRHHPWESLHRPDRHRPGTYPVVVDGSECSFNDATIVVTEVTPTTAPATTTTAVAVADAAAAAPAFTG